MTASRDLLYQLPFIADFLLHFFIEHHNSATLEPERNLKQIFVINIRDRLLFDTLTILPLYWMFESLLEMKYRKLLFLARVLRLYNGF
mmetsp:Transcript_22518/g.34814  ORF Transcript_22518/g.34814 Transcript_22518/m.34814 type:complete len:88 (+) Transcript_22518:303-566(+)